MNANPFVYAAATFLAFPDPSGLLFGIRFGESDRSYAAAYCARNANDGAAGATHWMVGAAQPGKWLYKTT